MQIAVIDFARNALGLEKANSTEFDPETSDPVIHIMEEQVGIKDKGATMRLGACPCTLSKDSLAHQAYARDEISERHRHRYEFNNDYRDRLSKAGVAHFGNQPRNGLG